MSDNESDDIVDRIDRLVDEQLAQEKSGYDHNINQERCHLCRSSWHGLEHPAGGCPGVFADDAQVEAWRTTNPHMGTGNAEIGATFNEFMSIVDSMVGFFGGFFGISSISDISDRAFAEAITETIASMNADIDSLPEADQEQARQLLTELQNFARGLDV